MPERTNTWISLGTNMGDRRGILDQALLAIAALPTLHILRRSSVLENPALLYTKQPPFLNQIAECLCELNALEFLEHLQQIELRLGRIRRFANGPREIDLDILTWGGTCIEHRNLMVPHPGLLDRPYLHTLFLEFGLDCQKLAVLKKDISLSI